jgi:UDP-N-acetylglucosamine 4,6-dehydratase/5-epimerase
LVGCIRLTHNICIPSIVAAVGYIQGLHIVVSSAHSYKGVRKCLGLNKVGLPFLSMDDHQPNYVRFMANALSELCSERDDLVNQCPAILNPPSGERVLIFGGSGSLGKTVIKRWIPNNQIMNVSRDEEKQWLLKTEVAHSNLDQMIGDIRLEEDVTHAILTYKPTIICIFACLKHIELCEKYPPKSVAINTHGIFNVHNVLMKYAHNVKSVLFVSTDKACLPITTYGCCKAISEFYLQGVPKAGVKWVGIRYGNVLNSSGSIIPHLQANALSPEPYKLTHSDMTRFIMTLDHSVNLIEYALEHGEHNEIIVPQIMSMRIQDLFELFCEKYKKTFVVSGLRCKEKIHEDLISSSEALQTYARGAYYHITPSALPSSAVTPFDSSKHIISKECLQTYLKSLKFIS